eukprot:15469431-Alexandrium_andersonii.AAC.1
MKHAELVYVCFAFWAAFSLLGAPRDSASTARPQPGLPPAKQRRELPAHVVHGGGGRGDGAGEQEGACPPPLEEIPMGE